MIAFLEGTLAEKTVDSAIVLAGGVGFSLGMSAHSLAQLPAVGSAVRVYTYLQMRDDGISLFGFSSLEEKAMFLQLIGVSSVGPKMALAALSTFAVDSLSSAIMAGDVAAVSRIPGVGKKKAQRIILELQGTLENHAALPLDAPAATGVERIVTEDLLAMGFTGTEAELALQGAPQEGTEAQVLQYALKRLGQ